MIEFSMSYSMSYYIVLYNIIYYYNVKSTEKYQRHNVMQRMFEKWSPKLLETFGQKPTKAVVWIYSSGDMTLDLFNHAKTHISLFSFNISLLLYINKYCTNILVPYRLKSEIPVHFCKPSKNRQKTHETVRGPFYHSQWNICQRGADCSIFHDISKAFNCLLHFWDWFGILVST